MKVKVCGITNLEDALTCQKLGADALGFIFYDKSKRYIILNEAAKIIKKLSPFVIKVGVFVNENPDVINKVAEKTGLNMVQLHGDEEPEDMEKINFPRIKGFRIKNGFDFSLLTSYKNVTYLLDAYTRNEYGGTGKTFNWQLIPDELKSKIILSGGISSDNVENIYRNIKPAAIDISSSLELYPGKKDRKKTEEFFKVLNYLRR